MATNQYYTIEPDIWWVGGEVTIGAAGAITPDANGFTCTSPLCTAVRASAGTYTITIPGNFFKVIVAEPTLRAAAASSVITEITGISLGGGTPTAGGESTTTITIITGNSNAVPAAADQSNIVIGFDVKFQKHKV